MTDFRSRLLSAAIDSLLRIVVTSILTGAGATALVALVLNMITASSNIGPIVSALVGIIVALGLFFILSSLRKSRVIIPTSVHDYQFDSLRIDIQFDTDGTVYYKRRYKVTALRDGLDRIVDSYAWTGGGTPRISCTAGDCEFRAAGRSGLFSLFEVIFPASLKKGAAAEFEITWECDNIGNVAIPFISRNISHPIETLEFSVRIPPNSNTGDAYLRISPHMQTQVGTQSTSHKFEDGRVSTIVKRPRLYSHYELRWRWK